MVSTTSDIIVSGLAKPPRPGLLPPSRAPPPPAPTRSSSLLTLSLSSLILLPSSFNLSNSDFFLLPSASSSPFCLLNSRSRLSRSSAMALRFESSAAKRAFLALRAARSASNDARWVGSERTLLAIESSWKRCAAWGLSGFYGGERKGE